MKYLTIALVAVILLSGCKSDEEKQAAAAKAKVEEAQQQAAEAMKNIGK